MKMRCVWATAVLAAWGIVAADAPADVVVLDNGARLVGKIASVATGKVVLNTDYAGTVTLESKRIVEITSATKLNVAFADGHRVAGTLAAAAGGPALRTDSGALPIADLQAVKAAWPEGQPDPTVAPGRKWAHEVALDVTGKTGNSRKTRVGGSARSVLAGPDDKTALYLRGAWAKEDGKETENELIGGADYERNLSKRQSWYTRVEGEQDDIEGVDLRATAAAGYGYYFVKDDPNLLRARIGVQYRREEYQPDAADPDGRNEDTVAAELGLRYEKNLGTWARLVSEVTYAPAVDDIQNYRIDHSSALDIPLNNSKHLSLRLGVTNSYNSTAPDDKQRLDTTYMARLVMKLP